MAATTEQLGYTYSLGVETDGETITVEWHGGDYTFGLDEMEHILEVASALGDEDSAIIDGTTIYVETRGNGGITLDSDPESEDPKMGSPTVNPSDMREYLDEARDVEVSNLDDEDPEKIRGFEIVDKAADLGSTGLYEDLDGDLWLAYKEHSHRDDNILLSDRDAERLYGALDEHLDG